MNIFKSQKGAAALISSIIVAAAILSITLSILIITFNMRAGFRSFSDSIQSFYSAEAGVGEALMQLRKEHNNFIFNDITVGGIVVSSEFVDVPGECQPIPECQFVPGSGWWGEYFNWLSTHSDMEVNPYPGPTPTPTEHDWYDDTYKTHEQIDADLEFPLSNWFPYNDTEWENKEGLANDNYFGGHWRAKVTAPATANYGYSLASDDDSWVVLNSLVVVNNSGVHASNVYTGDFSLTAGDNNIVELYFAERHLVQSGFSFSFDDPSLIITPWPEGCGEELECNSNIEATASTTRATRKASYTCNQEIANCIWSELTP